VKWGRERGCTRDYKRLYQGRPDEDFPNAMQFRILFAEISDDPFSFFDQPSELLAGLKPVEAIERGQLDLVWQVAEGLRTGSLL